MKDIFSDEALNKIDQAIETSISKRIFGVGEIIAGRYKVERVVGRGNFGYVYRVLDAQTGKKRALKTFYERLTARPGVADALRSLGARLAESKHPNLVRVYEVGLDGALVFFVEEFVSAFTLDRVVHAVAEQPLNQGFPIEQMAEILGQTCSALEDLPDLPHLGLNPHNIFASRTGVKVTDCGIAGVVRPALDEKDVAVLSGRTFLAPEFLRRGEGSAASDVYSLGRILEYLLTLTMPKTGVEPLHVRGDHPRALLDLARGASDHDPDLRLPSAGAFLGAFEAARHTPAAAAAAVEVTAEDRLAAAAQRADEAVSVGAAKPSEEAPPLREMERAAEAEFFGEALPRAEQPGALPSIEAEMPPLPGAAAKRAAVKTRPMVKRVEPKKFPLGLAAVIVLLLAAAVVFVFRNQIFPNLRAPAPQPPVAHNANQFDLEGITIRPEPGGPTFEEMIDALLLQAQQFVDTNRLIDPPDNCALANYNLILELDPKNVKARDGIAALEQRYLTLGRAFVSSKNYKRATWAFQSTLTVNRENKEAKEQLAALSRLAPERTPTTVAGATPEPIGPAATPEAVASAPPEPSAPLAQITAGVITGTVSRYMGRVRFCFARSPNASGVVTVRFVIEPTGEVTSAGVTNSTLANPEVEQCLVRRVLLMRFPAFEGSAKTVTFPFRLGQ